jgi:hypothetical protein
MMVGVRDGASVEVGVSGMRARVGNWFDDAGTHAAKNNNRLRIRKKRWNIMRL